MIAEALALILTVIVLFIVFFELSEPEKLWAVGDHRVKEKEVKAGSKKVIKSAGEYSARTEYVPTYEPGYKCVDCHKEALGREDFKDEICYEVIEKSNGRELEGQRGWK